MSELTGLSFTHRPTYIEINQAALKANFRAIKRLVAPSRVMASIKANACGHGLTAVARILEGEGIDGLGVAYIEEALELRRAGINVPILVFGGLLKDQLDLYIRNDIDVAASSISKLEQLDQYAKAIGRRARVHLKIDTGLERIGVHYYSAQSLFEAALRTEWCDVVGVFSHFASVDPEDLSLARTQLERFLYALEYYQERAGQPFVRHIANSGGLLALPESRLDMVRPGVSLYGIYPYEANKSTLNLQPVLSLKSRIVLFKVVRAGSGVSYDHTWHAPLDTRVVTVPIGYGDGYLRAFSNNAKVLIRGVKYPIIGRICMDQLMVDLGPDGVGYNGDEVVLIGEQQGGSITISDLSASSGSSPYEILVTLNQRIPRIVI